MDKPFRFKLYKWNKLYFPVDKVKEKYGEEPGLGFCIEGYKTKEPRYGTYWRTSWIVNMDNKKKVETRNSYYELVGKEGKSRG